MEILLNSRDNDKQPFRPQEMLFELRADNRELTRFLRMAHEVYENDVASASLIQVWIDQNERRAWFLSEIVRDL
jgi:starvation-inducible DNA-binding protein